MQVADQKIGLAMLCSLTAMAIFGLVDNFIALATETFSLWQFHMLRAGLALVILGVAARALGWRLTVHRPKAVALRTTFAGTAMVIYFGCLGYMPIAQAVAGLFTAPIFVVIFSALIWKEQIGPRRVIAVIIGFSGILLVLRPDTVGLNTLTIMPVIAGAFHALGTITTRRWCAEESTLAILGAFFVLMLIVGAIGILLVGTFVATPPVGAEGFVFRGWTPVTPTVAFVVVTQSVGSLFAVWLIIRSYQLAEPSFIAIFENTLLVFATLWAFVLYAEWPDILAVVGMGLIVLAGIIIAVRSKVIAPRTT
ncbi:MAG: DMT family transporter [Pseudomonadota bacterium]